MVNQSPRDTYQQIAEKLRSKITDGTYPPARALPAESALMSEFGVARDTVRHALALLKAEGLVSVVHGVGHFVIAPNEFAPGQPKHRVISANLRQKIESGSLAPGAKLPSESQLERDFKVSRTTVRRALSELETEGLIATDGLRGRFVLAQSRQ